MKSSHPLRLQNDFHLTSDIVQNSLGRNVKPRLANSIFEQSSHHDLEYFKPRYCNHPHRSVGENCDELDDFGYDDWCCHYRRKLFSRPSFVDKQVYIIRATDSRSTNCRSDTCARSSRSFPTHCSFSYIIFSLNFEKQSLNAFLHKATTVGTLMFVIIIMYMVELAARFQSPRPLVVVHHLCALADALLAAVAPTTANMRAASLLVYFICFEALTFLGLVMYRLWPQHKATRPIILAGMLLFGLSRPVQVIWIFASLIVVWDDIEKWQAILQMVLTMLFTALQLYSLTIHYGMYKRCGVSRSQLTSTLQQEKCSGKEEEASTKKLASSINFAEECSTDESSYHQGNADKRLYEAGIDCEIEV